MPAAAAFHLTLSQILASGSMQGITTAQAFPNRFPLLAPLHAPLWGQASELLTHQVVAVISDFVGSHKTWGTLISEFPSKSMARKTVNQKLRKVDRRIARIDRRLGFLESRIYFKPFSTADWQEVQIFSFIDAGITPESVATGEKLSAHRFVIKVDRDWIEIHLLQEGQWAVQRSSASEWVECEKENEEYQDTDTYATITLRVSQEIVIPEIVIEP